MTSVAQRRRPGVITFIGVVIYIQALLAGVTAIVALINQNDAGFQEGTGQTADQLLALGIVEGVLALVLVGVAMMLMSGSRGARTLIAIVMFLRIGVAGWAVLTHHSGGVFGTAVITIVVGLIVLWALYGHQESEEYFA